MANLKQKSYLITNIPLGDWKRFKRWTAIMEYDNLNHAFATLIRQAGNNEIAFTETGTVNETQAT